MSPGVISSIQTVGIGARGSDPGPRARAFKTGARARAPDPGPAAPAQTRAPGLDPGPQDRGPKPGSWANGRAEVRMWLRCVMILMHRVRYKYS